MYKLINLTEKAVMEKIVELRDKVNCCSCERCTVDVASYALNRLKPRYVVGDMGNVMSEMMLGAQQSDMDISTAVLQGFAVIGENPNH